MSAKSHHPVTEVGWRVSAQLSLSRARDHITVGWQSRLPGLLASRTGLYSASVSQCYALNEITLFLLRGPLSGSKVQIAT